MHEESIRPNVNEADLNQRKTKLGILLQQQTDLSLAIN
jgi:hypothetical protein